MQRREVLGRRMRLCTGQHKKTKQLHCLQGPAIRYEKDKDISPSAREPLLPNKQFSCWNYGPCSNLFIVKVRMASSALKNTNSTRLFQKIRHQKGQLDPTWSLPQQCNTTFTNCPKIYLFFLVCVLFLCWKSKKYSAKISKTLLSQLQSISLDLLQMVKDLTTFKTVQNPT